MTTQRDDVLDRVASLLEPTPEALPNFHRRMRRRHRSRRIGAYAMVAVIAVVAVVAIAVVRNGPTPPVPADPPSEGLGIFAPVAGRIVFTDSGLWAVDTSAPSDSTAPNCCSCDRSETACSRSNTSTSSTPMDPKPD
jgi:hypothetical protein